MVDENNALRSSPVQPEVRGLTGRQLIQIILENNFEDFTLRFRFDDAEMGNGFDLRDFTIDFLDAGYSEKVLLLTGDEVKP